LLPLSELSGASAVGYIVDHARTSRADPEKEVIELPSLKAIRAQEVVEEQCEVHEQLRLLRQHPTVVGNRVLRECVEAATRSIERANVVACVVWFREEADQDRIAA
jgi:hypothetical protein